MIKTRYLTTLVAALALSTSASAAEPAVKVVASFSILGDLVHQVGGDRVAVTTLVGPDGDAHVYEPTPANIQELAAADLLVVNGLGFEGWMDRLEKAASFGGVKVVATEGIEPLAFEGEHEEHEGEAHAEADHDEEHADEKHHAAEAGHEAEHEEEHHHHHGSLDPHAWQSLANGRIYVANIVAGLSKADPDGAATYRQNGEAYTAKIAALEAEVTKAIGALPADRRKIVTSHDAFGYFAHAYRLEFLAPQGVSTESEASAADVASLIRQIRAEGIHAVFVENISDPRLLEQITRETGARIGGTLYSDALSSSDATAATYLDMFRHNVATLTDALGS